MREQRTKPEEDWSFRIGTTIKVVRRLKGMAQKELATQCGITPHYISVIETGIRTCNSLQTLGAIATALDMSLSALVALAERPESLEAAVGAARKTLQEFDCVSPVTVTLKSGSPTTPKSARK